MKQIKYDVIQRFKKLSTSRYAEVRRISNLLKKMKIEKAKGKSEFPVNK